MPPQRSLLHGRQRLRLCLLLALFMGEYNVLPRSWTTKGHVGLRVEAIITDSERHALRNVELDRSRKSALRKAELDRSRKLFEDEERKAEKNAAAVLGLKTTATETEVKNAYRTLAAKHHPVNNPGSAAAEKYFQSIKDAYDVLRERDQTSGEPTPKESPGVPPPRVPRTEGTSFPAPRLLLVTAAAAALICFVANKTARQRTAREQRKQRERTRRAVAAASAAAAVMERTRRSVAAASAAAAVAAAANEDYRQTREQNDADKSREPRPGGHYATLGIRSTATEQEVRTAYGKASLMHHPDRNPGDTDAARRFCEIKNAYYVLADGQQRRMYNMVLSGEDRQAYDRMFDFKRRKEDHVGTIHRLDVWGNTFNGS